MSMNLFVGGLPFAMTDDELRTVFEEYGTVSNAKIIMDRETNRSRGFGFVEFEIDEEGQAAIDGLNEKEVGGRKIFVSVARDKQ